MEGAHVEQRSIARTILAAAGGVVCVCGLALAQPGGPARATPVGGARDAAGREAARGAGANGAPPALPGIGMDDPEVVTLSAFAEPVTMNTLVELVATALNINVTIIGDVPGTVRFNAPVPVKKTELLGLLATLLEQQGWTVTRDRFGLYTVHANANVVPNAKGELATTRVFRTPNMRPSSLKTFVDGLIGMPQAGAQGGQRQYAYIDDVGVIIATDTPRRLEALAEVIEAVQREERRLEYQRIALDHITAGVARERALQLIGQATIATPARTGAPGEQAAGVTPQRNLTTLYSLADRLSVDQQGNALIFRGTSEEIEQVRRVLAVIDVPNELMPRAYTAGKSAAQVADIARGRGLGEVITIAATSQSGFGFDINRGQLPGQGRQGVQTQGTTIGGPLMVVDEQRGQIIYYGTASQQAQLQALLDQLDTEAEAVVTRVYKLRNANAEDLAEIINGVISSTSPVGTAPLLPGDSGGRRGFSTPRQQPPATPRPAGGSGSGSGGDEGIALDASDAFVYPDVKNNQLLVKAQAGQQPEFARLIEKLDLRRPQVYVEAKIVAVNADDRLRTAFETQLINANATGGVFTQSFGLANYGSGSNITTRPTVNALTGFTAAIIRNDMVPIVMTALANETDSRIISNPQLLVDDNEEAEVVSLDQQPTSTISRGSSGQTDLVTSGDYAEAGTTLRVTPQISDGGYMRLKYNIQLSSFTGEGQVVGGTTLPPPRQENTISSNSITVPSDSTVVVGGLVVDSKTKTVAKVPLLGDIPLLGLLFQDRSTGDRKTVLYVFLTPRVLRDPTFQDLKLLTRGPRASVGLPEDTPPLTPSKMEIVLPRPGPAPAPMPETGAGAGRVIAPREREELFLPD